MSENLHLATLSGSLLFCRIELLNRLKRSERLGGGFRESELDLSSEAVLTGMALRVDGEQLFENNN